jgi:hypothetical protein
MAHAPPPEVEVGPPPETRVKAPAGKVIVEMPAPAEAPCAPAVTSAPAPQQLSAPVTLAQPQTYVPTVAVPVQQPTILTTAAPQSAPAPGVATTTQTVRPARTRLALAMVRVPVTLRLPWFRLVPFTVPAEVTTTTEIESAPQTVAAAAVAQPQFATQALMQPTMMAFQQPTMMAVQPTAMAVQPTAMAVQPTTMAVQSAPVALTAAAPQPQAAPATVLRVVTVPQTTATQANVCPPVSQDTLQRLSQELEQTKAVLNSLGAAPSQSGAK